MPGLPVHHQFPEFTQTHVRRVGDAIQPSHPLLSPSPPAFRLSQHQGLFQRVSPSKLACISRPSTLSPFHASALARGAAFLPFHVPFSASIQATDRVRFCLSEMFLFSLWGKKKKSADLLLAVLGLGFRLRLSWFRKQRPLFVEACGLRIAVTSLVARHGLLSSGFSSCSW